MTTITSKHCNGCNSELSLDMFYKKTKSTVRSRCKKCLRLARKKTESKYASTYNARVRRKSLLKISYGITLEDFDLMLKNQNYCCAICKSPSPAGRGEFHVDHDHKTKKVRGLLCHHCNLALGNFRDNTTILLSAIDYLNESNKF